MENKLTYSLLGGKVAILVSLSALKVLANERAARKMMELGPIMIN